MEDDLEDDGEDDESCHKNRSEELAAAVVDLIPAPADKMNSFMMILHMAAFPMTTPAIVTVASMGLNNCFS